MPPQQAFHRGYVPQSRSATSTLSVPPPHLGTFGPLASDCSASHPSRTSTFVVPTDPWSHPSRFRGRWCSLVEELHRHLKDTGDLMQAARAHPVHFPRPAALAALGVLGNGSSPRLRRRTAQVPDPSDLFASALPSP